MKKEKNNCLGFILLTLFIMFCSSSHSAYIGQHILGENDIHSFTVT